MAASTRPADAPVSGIPTAVSSWTRIVLETYTQAMARSRDERAAFDAAVAVYLAYNPQLSEPEARRGVAILICGEG